MGRSEHPRHHRVGATVTRSVEERLAAIETRDATYREDMAEVKKDVREIRDAVLTAKGGWKALAIVFALGSFIGGIATKLIAYLPLISR